jgi:ArsR family metal-binding transcriptional regulator
MEWNNDESIFVNENNDIFICIDCMLKQSSYKEKVNKVNDTRRITFISKYDSDIHICKMKRENHNLPAINELKVENDDRIIVYRESNEIVIKLKINPSDIVNYLPGEDHKHNFMD